jgi:L-asparagine transporter-like permease
VALAHPLLGAGFNYYSIDAYEKYYPEFLDMWPGKYWTCHSIWFSILSEHGFLAIILWIWLLCSCLFSLRALRAYAQDHAEKSWIIPYIDMIQVALITYMVVGTFLDAAYFDMIYQLIFVIVILKERSGWAAFQAAKITPLELAKSAT